MAASFAWEKAVGDQAELDWWERAALDGAQHGCEAHADEAGTPAWPTSGPRTPRWPTARWPGTWSAGRRRRSGVRALDAGAGSGVAGRALRSPGRAVVAADRESDMAALRRRVRPAVTADVTGLPFRNGAFDVVVAAFVVNHLPDPAAGLRELRRVTRPGGAVLASTFSADRAAAKEAVDGWPRRTASSRPTGTPTCRTRAGRRAPVLGRASARGGGFARWTVTEEPVDVGITAAADVVRYRLGLPHLHGSRPAGRRRRAAFVADAVEAVRRTGERFAPVVVEAVAVA